MSILSELIGGGSKGVLDGVKGIIGEFHMDPAEKAALNYKIQELLQKRDSELEATARAELDVQKSIIVAELNQGDLYTKRARPSVIYGGLLFIFIDYVVLPVVSFVTGKGVPTLALPTEFWYAWSSIVATYAIGRTLEKRGTSNGFTKIVTGK